MRNNGAFSSAVGVVLLIITYQICARAIPLLNGATDAAFDEGLTLLITACAMWLGFILLLLRSVL